MTEQEKKQDQTQTRTGKKPYARPILKSSDGFNTVVLQTDCTGACQIQFSMITT